VTAKLEQVTVFSSDREVSRTAFASLAASFFRLAEVRLSPTQKVVLCTSHGLLRDRTVSMTALADLISRTSGVAYSTVKWNLRALRKMGLLIGGDSDCKGRPAHLTVEGRMLAEYFDSQV